MRSDVNGASREEFKRGEMGAVAYGGNRMTDCASNWKWNDDIIAKKTKRKK